MVDARAEHDAYWRQREYSKKQNAYARANQRQAQDKINQEYNTQRNNIMKQIGAATGDDAATAELTAQLSALDQERKDKLAATKDLSQYTEGFNEEEYDNKKEEEKAAAKEEKATAKEEAIKEVNANTDIKNKSGGFAGYLGKVASGVAKAANSTDSTEMAARQVNKDAAEQKANLHEQLANEEQKTAETQKQIANRNARTEAGKDAVTAAEAQNAQKVANMGNVSAGAAALERGVGDASKTMSEHRQRSDTLREAGLKNTQQAADDRQEAVSRREEGTVGVFEAQGTRQSNNETNALSEGTATIDAQEEQQTPQQETQEQEQEQEQEQPQPEQTQETPQPEQTQETPQPEQTQETPEAAGTTWQNLMNYITYGNDPTSGWSTGAKPGAVEAKKYAEAHGWKPITATQEEYDGDTGHLQQLVAQNAPDFYKEWQQSSNRIQNGQQINAGDAGYEEAAKTTTESDARMKNIIGALSSIRF